MSKKFKKVIKMKPKNKQKKSTRKNTEVSKNQHNRLLSRTKGLEERICNLDMFLHKNLTVYKDLMFQITDTIKEFNDRFWKLEARICYLRELIDECKPKDTQDK